MSFQGKVAAGLVAASVLIAMLAYFLSLSWMYVVAGTLALVGTGQGLAAWLEIGEPPRAPVQRPAESLESLGLSEARPAAPDAAPAAGPTPVANEDASAAQTSEAAAAPTPVDNGPSDDARPASVAPVVERPPVQAIQHTPLEDAPVWVPYMQALRAALSVQTVALLAQEEVALEYRIAALVSEIADVQVSGTFRTHRPLLTATMSREKLALCSSDDKISEVLRYYATPPTLQHAALAPISTDGPTTYFLVADTSQADLLSARRPQRLMKSFAQTMALLIDGPHAASEAAEASAARADQQAAEARPADQAHAAPAPSDAEAPDTEPSEAASPAPAPEPTPESDVPDAADANPEASRPPAQRTRREIIAEEMHKARQSGDELALALIYLNRAEAIANEGAEAVQAAEQSLGGHLSQRIGPHRMERFGELMYGVFVREPETAVEQWGGNLQEAMSAADGWLAGGVSIGIAIVGPHHDTPDALRDDATEALEHAFQTGTCTIIG